MIAYKVTLSDGKELTGASSDKEYVSGQAVHEVLESKGLNNVLVFVRKGMEVATWVLRNFKSLKGVQLKQLTSKSKK